MITGARGLAFGYHRGIVSPVNAVTARVPAKVNLQLSVGPARADGYHELVTVFHAVSLFDEVTVAEAEHDSVRVTGEGAKSVPRDGANLAARAAAALSREVGAGCRNSPGLAITINKRIPVAAGLAGGSADAAATLVACNELWGTGLSQRELAVIAAGLGSDVAFALLGGTAIGVGRGERVTPALAAGTYHWVLAFARGGLSTPDVYAACDRIRASRPGQDASGAQAEAPVQRPSDQRPSDQRPSVLRPADLRPADLHPADPRRGDQRRGDSRRGDPRPGRRPPGDPRRGDAQPGRRPPGDPRRGDAQPGRRPPGDSRPGGPRGSDPSDPSDPVPPPALDNRLMAALRSGDPVQLGQSLSNDLQPAALSLRPGLRRALAAGLEYGALGAIVSGSGPTCVYLARNADRARELAVALTGAGVCRSVAQVTGPAPGAAVITAAAARA